MVDGNNLELLGCSKLANRRTYATSHLLFQLTGNPLCTGLRMFEISQIGAAGPVDVEAQLAGSGPSYRGVPTEVVVCVEAYSIVSSGLMCR